MEGNEEELADCMRRGYAFDIDEAKEVAAAYFERDRLKLQVSAQAKDIELHLAAAENMAKNWSDAEKEVESLNRQVEGLRKYVSLLVVELESAVGVAYLHGWRSTREKIEEGRQLRAQLGIEDSGLDAYAGAPTTEKRKYEPPGCCCDKVPTMGGYCPIHQERKL